MKRNLLKLAAAAAIVALAGCATGVKYGQMATSMPAVKANEARVYFFRSSSMVGAALQPEIRLNDQVVGKSQPGGFFYVDRPAGKYTAATATETEKVLTFVLEAGETKYVRSSPSLGILVGRINLELEAPEKAKAELADLSYTGAQTAAK
jgi:hypothetical protein